MGKGGVPPAETEFARPGPMAQRSRARGYGEKKPREKIQRRSNGYMDWRKLKRLQGGRVTSAEQLWETYSTSNTGKRKK